MADIRKRDISIFKTDVRKRDLSVLKARFHGLKLRSKMTSLSCYDEFGTVKRFEPGSFVPHETIKKFRMKSKWFVHPDTLRLSGSFEFAHRKKRNFSVGIIRMMPGRGDILLASVLAKALKYEYGNDVECWFAIRPEYHSILEHCPFVDRIYSSKKRLLGDVPDININVDDLDFKVEKKEFESGKKATKNRAAIYLDQLGLHLENKTPIYIVTEEEKQWAKEKLEELGYEDDRPIIGVQLYGSRVSRTYPFMDKVIKKLKSIGQVFLLDEADNNQKHLYNLKEIAALINEMDVIITPNSFFYHLAGALKKRAVAIFGSCDGGIWTEDYEKIISLDIKCPEGLDEKCWWQLKCLSGKTMKQREAKVPACLSEITPEMVEQEVLKHFQERRKILVVVLTYDFVNMSVQMVDSIRSFHDYDVVIIDNKSSDDTAKWARKEGLEFISKRQSVAQAWNMGLELAYDRGYDYCLLCNNDIVLSPTYIDTVVECLERRKAYAVTGNVLSRANVVKPMLSKFAEMIKGIEVIITGQKAGDYSALLVSRECIEKIGKFDDEFGPRYQADEDHLLRVRLSGHDIVRTYKTIFLHLLGQVIKQIPEARASHLADWERGVKLFKRIWKIDLYANREIFKNLEEIKRRNPSWKRRIHIPIHSKSKTKTAGTPGCLREAVEKKLASGRQAKVYITRRMGGYGDILFTTVLAKALRKRFGEKVIIHYAALRQFMPLLKNNPYIDKVNISQPREFNPFGYDYILDLTDYEFQVELKEIENWGEVARARTRIYLDLAGLDGDLKPDYFVTNKEKEWAENTWQKNGTGKRIIVVGKGSNLMKVWPGMSPLFDRLRNDSYNVLLLDMKDLKFNDYKYSFRQAAALVSTSNLVVAPDSGISNLAGALDIPALTIFANRNGKIFARMFKTMVVVQGKCPIHKEGYCDFKADCFKGGLYQYLSKENKEIPQCLQRLPVEEVYSKVKDILSDKPVIKLGG